MNTNISNFAQAERPAVAPATGLVAFDRASPRGPNSPFQIVAIGQQMHVQPLRGGDKATIEVDQYMDVGNMERATLALIEQIEEEPIDGNVLRNKLKSNVRAMADACESLNQMLTQERQFIAKARTLLSEVMRKYGSLSAVSEEFGQDTVASLLYLQAAFINGDGFIDMWDSESRLLQMLKQLPSGALWAKHVRFRPELAAA